MQALAKVANGAVTVLSHPSLAGIASGSGISGSTAWHGAFRFRMYLTSAKPEAGEQPDGDLRELQFRKKEQATLITKSLISVGKKLEARGQELSPAQTSHSYAPTVVAKQPEAKGIKKTELVAALERLIDRGRVSVEVLKAGTARQKSVVRF